MLFVSRRSGPSPSLLVRRLARALALALSLFSSLDSALSSVKLAADSWARRLTAVVRPVDVPLLSPTCILDSDDDNIDALASDLPDTDRSDIDRLSSL